MDITHWWPRLSAATRDWLVANNGDVLPEGIADEIRSAGGGTDIAEQQDDESALRDDATDWIEATANGESD
ncbi:MULTISPECIES: hypothetical protein [unclassified Rathayibacter]|uniref:hypothetical protein n=1 Tax=unclassified Rathayibacter TaxID=2609250 RepID=UPI0006F75C3E|nr:MULTISPECIES: hypothetical protein [unclassified Rathayibacter]KQQ01506.1 hypothetical protein ASF42_13745 [Rathayibacter sp. Leaf294]KQS11538.1 hypothetical protein ASG06_13745 [Rathayibacter sp. Leaf185]